MVLSPMLPSLAAGDKSRLGRVAQQYDVTSVGVNPADDRAHRMRMYFIAMSLRVLCIVSLFWVRGFWIVIAALGAVLLPYFAVLIANAVSHVSGHAPETPSPRELSQPLHLQGEESDESTLIVVDAPIEPPSDNDGGSA